MPSEARALQFATPTAQVLRNEHAAAKR